jgi:predicted permease
MDELRMAIRRLRKRPAAVIVSVITLAVSIGAAAAAWSVLSVALLHPLQIPDADRLVAIGVTMTGPKGPFTNTVFTYSMLPAVRDGAAFGEVTFGGTVPAQITADGDTRSRSIFFVTSNFFGTIKLPVQLGRDFTADDDRRGVAPVAILSDRLWRTALAADPDIVGKTIGVEHHPVRVIGVGARGFAGMSVTSPADLFLPLHTVGDAISMLNPFAEPSTRTSPSAWVSAFGRLRPSDRPDAVAAKLGPIVPGLSGRPVTLVPAELNALAESARAPMQQFARLLATTLALLVLVGALTVGMLLLLRTEARQDEFAMCLALGASRGQLVAGIALEGVLLAAAGAVLAIPAATACFGALESLRLPGGVSVAALDLSVDWRVFEAVVAIATTVTLLVTLVSGAFGFRATVANVLRTRAGSTPRVMRRRTRAALVACQVAATLVLLTGAGLFARSLAAALHLNAGFDASRIVTSNVQLWQYRMTPDLAKPFFANLRDRLEALPAIRSAAIISEGAGMTPSGFLVVDGVERHFPSFVAETGVDDHYFRTVGLSILRGRDFTAQDDDRAPFVTIVSDSFGRMLANGGNPVGMHIRAFHGKAGQPFPVIEVIGVVPDVVVDVSRAQPLAMYMSLPQTLLFSSRTLLVRPTTSVAEAERETVAMLKAADPSLDPAPIASPLMTLDEKILSTMTPQRLGAVVLGALGFIALLLTILGTYVLSESMASARMREMGVRAALGATGRDLGSIVMRDTARLVGIGLVAGLMLAWIEASTVKALLFRVQPLDPLTLVLAASSILALTLLVTLRPAIAAARVDLARLLRDE